MKIKEGARGTLRASAIALLLVTLTLPGGAQERPLGDEVERAREGSGDSMTHHAREMERLAREMRRHRREMELHARAMNQALMRAYRDSSEFALRHRELADSMRARFFYRARMHTPCARMGIAFTGEDTISVREVMPGSGAAEAGVRVGDVIVSVDGERANARSLAALGERLEAGDRVRLVVRRGAGEQTIDVVAREDVCPARTMLSRTPFRVLCLTADSAEAAEREECHFGPMFGMREDLRELHRGMPWRVKTEESDSGVWLRFHGRTGPGDSVFIDLDSVRALTEGMTLHLDSVAGMMPFALHLADSVMGMMPFMEMREATEDAYAEGVMLRSLSLGAHALAGARLTDLNPDLARYFEAERGALVTEVDAGTPAARAGLQGGDVIVAINGADVSGVREVRRRAAAEVGTIELTVIRGGERRVIRLAAD